MFKCVLKRENNELNYDFPNAVFMVESFSYDDRRDIIDCRVVGFADEFALESYKNKIKNAVFHDLEKSMIYNKHHSVKVADVNSTIHEIVDINTFTALPYLKEVIEKVIINTEQIFSDAEIG